MSRDQYDWNGDGIVNAADRADEADLAHDSEALGGHSPEYYASNDKVDNLTPEDVGAAAPSVAVAVSLSGWSASGDGFAKTATVAGVTPTSNVIVSPAAASFSAWADGVVRATELGMDSITFFAESDPGTVTANILIVG